MLDNIDKEKGEKFVAGDVYEVRFAFFLATTPGNHHTCLAASLLFYISRHPEDPGMDIRC